MLLLFFFRVYGKFTMEVILASAFGVQADIQTDPDEPYTPNAEQMFKAPPLSVVLSKYSQPFLIQTLNWGRGRDYGGVHKKSLDFSDNQGLFINNLGRTTEKKDIKVLC